MLPDFNQHGLLPPGIHWTDWDELQSRYGTTPWRGLLLSGLRAALENLKDAGCAVAYIDGSFVTDKEVPKDFDACWAEHGVDLSMLDPVLQRFERRRAAQKRVFFGELMPAGAIADAEGRTFLEFFQLDRDSGRPKGIVAIDLRGLT